MSLTKSLISSLRGQTRFLLKATVTPQFHNQTRNLRILVTRRHRLMYHRAKEHAALDPPPEIRREFLEWNQRAEMFAFSKRLKENMSEDLLKVVFTDWTYLAKERKQREELGMASADLAFTHNGQLADNGRQLMHTFISQYLRYFLPKLPEEGIIAIRDFLLSEESLADMSKQLGTSDLILSEDPFPTPEQMARVLQAFIGGLIQEQGSEHAKKFVIDFILTYLYDQHIFELWDLDARQAVNTILANQQLPPYEPRIIRETGRHTIQPCFAVGLFVNQNMISWSSAETEQEAEEMAAFDALKRWFEIRPGDFVYKYGKESYNLPFDKYAKENVSFKDWSPEKCRSHATAKV